MFEETDMGMTLDGSVVLVTGGTKGVGRGIARRFAEAGARVAVCARHEPEAGLPDGWVFLPADLRDAEAAFAVVDAVVERFGRLDGVVNNAGGAPPADTSTASPRFSERIVALNLLAPLHVAQRANRHMQAADGGTIVNITSVAALRPAPTAAAYGAAKAGLVNLTATLAQELAPKVRVNAVCCGMILTEQAALHYGDEAGVARVGATVPLGRLATPEEIGDVAVWLASPRSSYVTGANVVVHGGGDRPPFLDAAG
jgi:NAD(P)-dependent dehydrogenase (short-subunit alcohol dehydrogenase family)